MKWFRNNRVAISLTFACSLLTQLFYPTVGWAINGRDRMPEYQSFTPVGSSDLVNPFDGSFSYSVPLLSIPNGTAITMGYNSSDVNPEAQASWVGLGWSLNPGAVVRQKRGFPDEFEGETVTYHNRMPANWTVSGDASLRPELFGWEQKPLSVGVGITYNNYHGLGSSVNLGMNLAGVSNLGLNYQTPGRFGWSADVNPLATLNRIADMDWRKGRKTAEMKPNNHEGLKQKQESYAKVPFRRRLGRGFSMDFPQPTTYPTTLSDYNGGMFKFQLDGGINWTPLPIAGEGSISGAFNIQKNVEEVEKQVYGYEHLEGALADEEAMMDYYTEADQPFQKRNTVVGYPVANHDMYMMHADGFGGTYRPYRAEFGHYRMDKTKGEDFSGTLGLDVKVPSVVGILPGLTFQGQSSMGYSLSGNYHWTTVDGWENSGQAAAYKFGTDAQFPRSGEKVFYRFSDDPAGFYGLVDGADPVSADVQPDGLNASTNMSAFTSSPQNMISRIDARSIDKQKQRSTYVNHHPNGWWDSQYVSQASPAGIPYRVYQKNTRMVTIDAAGELDQIVDYDYTDYPAESTGEIVTYNSDGMTYVFAQPLYARNEKQVSYGVKGNIDELVANNVVYLDDKVDFDKKSKRKTGFESEAPYATTHLVSQVLNPEYIDRTGDGPTRDDFGDYVKYTYARTHGCNGDQGNDWFPSRTPFEGLGFAAGSLSDNGDDMGSVSYFEKEIAYVNQIASKTHVAFFYVSDRADGTAIGLSNDPTMQEVIDEDNGGSHDKLKKLDRIELYSLDDCLNMGPIDATTGNPSDIGIYEPKTKARPIQTVHLKYSYELCGGWDGGSPKLKTNDGAPVMGVDENGLPVNLNDNAGKLTLTAVWSEYEGKLRHKFHPYEFEYEYPEYQKPNAAPAADELPVPSEYLITDNSYNVDVAANDPAYNADGMLDYGRSSYYNTANNWNPDYASWDSDRWGSYRAYEADHEDAFGDLARFYPYVNQNPDRAKFDPAAWMLKRIKLPSKGEILVQYEQHDYQYVQDKRATVMVPLKEGPGWTQTRENMSDKRYYLDLDKLGISTTGMNVTELEVLAEDLFDPAFSDRDRLFFHFLYAILGENPDYRYTSSDFIEGYARINGFGVEGAATANDPGRIYFTFKGGDSNANFTPIVYNGNASKRELPRRVCKEFFRANRRGKIGTMGTNALDDQAQDPNFDIRDLFNAFLSVAESAGDQVEGACREMKPEMSYVRLRMPITKKKLAGGVRVKRLLTHGAPILGSNDVPVLYGREMLYTAHLDPDNAESEVISSGVAPNEPAEGRRESALVNVIEKDAQGWANALLFGRDMYGQEGPLGEAFLPSPGIGYANVTSKPIFQGQTATGTQVYEYYTCRDFPFRAEATLVDQVNQFPISLGSAVGVGGGNDLNLSFQRRAVHLAQGYSFINNAMHGKTKRKATYPQGLENNAYAETVIEYYQPGDRVDVMDEDHNITEIEYTDMGRATDLYSETREVLDHAVGGGGGIDVTTGAFAIGPPFFPIPIPLTLPISTTSPGDFKASFSEQIMRSHVTTKTVNYPAMVKSIYEKKDGNEHLTTNTVFDNHTGAPVVTKSEDDFKGAYWNQVMKASWEYGGMTGKYKNEGLVITPSHPDLTGITFDFLGGGKLKIKTAGANACAVLKQFSAGDFIEVATGPGTNSTYRSLYHIEEVDLANQTLITQSSMFNFYAPVGNLQSITILRSGRTNELNADVASFTFFSEEGKKHYYEGFDNIHTGHPFADALNNWMGTIQTSTPQTVSTTLMGPFLGMDISNYAVYLPPGCANSININAADLTSVSMEYHVDPQTGQLSVTVLGFEVAGCSGTVTCVISDDGGPPKGDPKE